MNIVKALKYCKPSPVDENVYEKELSCVGVTPLNAADSHICSVRNVKFWTKLLGGVFLGNEEQIDEIIKVVKKIDVMFIGATPLQWCKYANKIAILVGRSTKVVWLNDDYTIETPSVRTKSDCHMYKAVRELTQKRPLAYKVFANSTASRHAANEGCFNKFDFNLLSWDQKQYDQPRTLIENKTLVGYYGSCRVNRRELFNKWFSSIAGSGDLKLQSKSSIKKWKMAVPTIQDVSKHCSIDEIVDGTHFSIYMQDANANNVNSRTLSTPSTRIYEMACRHWPFVITEECRQALEIHGMVFPDDWYISCPEEIRLVDVAALKKSHKRFWQQFNVVDRLTTAVKSAMNILKG